MFAVYISAARTRVHVHAHGRVRRNVPGGILKGYIHDYKAAAARQEAICGRCNLQEFAAELSARARARV